MRDPVTGWLALTCIMALCRVAGGGELVVPVPVQVEMLSKLAGFDRSFRERAGSEARVLVVETPASGDSHRAAQQIRSAFIQQPKLAGVPVSLSMLSYTGPAALAGACAEHKANVVYLAPGFDEQDVRAIAKALVGVTVLTASAAASDVAAGAVVGFDLVEGKPKILVNLPQAQKQGVAFAATLLSLARVLQ